MLVSNKDVIQSNVKKETAVDSAAFGLLRNMRAHPLYVGRGLKAKQNSSYRKALAAQQIQRNVD